MTREKFVEFWNGAVAEWLESDLDDKASGKKLKINTLCSVKENVCHRIYKNYSQIKDVVKKLYFKDKDIRISRFKRAAVIVYAIIAGEDPIEYKDQKTPVDNFFLKQRFAFSLALTSIIQDYEVETKPIFCFSDLGKTKKADEDDFLLSVYKDLFYSEIYKNYNVLTMANIFGLLVERASTLKELRKN